MSKRILIADDEPAIALSLEFLLRNAGFDTQIACDGDEALRYATAFSPDLIVLDLMLPRKSGLEVCRTLRADAEQRATKILMLTARGAANDYTRAGAAGVDAYLVKPFSTHDLLQQVRRLLATLSAVHAS